jgi:hypothetical protein
MVEGVDIAEEVQGFKFRSSLSAKLTRIDEGFCEMM